jgi:hypothetical protein
MTELRPLERSSSVKPATAIRTASIFVLATLLWSAPAFSQDTKPTPPEEENPEYLDRELLVDTLMRDDALEVYAVRDARDAAQEALDEAIEDEAPQEVIDELEKELEEAEGALVEEKEDFAVEQDTIEEQVDEMSDDQVIAMNRSLNNTLHNGLIPVISSDDIMRLLEDGYSAEQINAFTKAYEAEAIFVRQRDRFEDKYEDTGKEQFLRNAERADAKAANEKAKFLAKVDRFDSSDEVEAHDSGEAIEAAVSAEMRDSARDVARDLARHAARDAEKEARRVAKRAGRDAAKESAAELAKDTAKNQARAEAKQLAKAERGNQGRGHAKGKDN